MRVTEIFEQGTIGSTPMPTAGGSTVPTTAAPASTPPAGANPQQTQQMAAATLAQQQKDKAARRKQIQDQITALQGQLRTLTQQLSSVK